MGIFLSFLLQILMTFGVLFAFGFLIHQARKIFFRNFGSWARTACFVTGVVGTPIHECSHALFCLIFGHKIIEIKLFQWDNSGTLGYVRHAYNRRNVYHIIGNFFIGIAPLVVITGILYLLAWLMLPEIVAEWFTVMGALDTELGFGATFAAMGQMLAGFFMGASQFSWWMFVLIGAMLFSHMALSGADIRSSLGGMLILMGLFLVVDIILGIIGDSVLDAFTGAIVSFGIHMAVFLLLALAISVIAILVSLLIKIIFKK